jgi:hypothetical protein
MVLSPSRTTAKPAAIPEEARAGAGAPADPWVASGACGEPAKAPGARRGSSGDGLLRREADGRDVSGVRISVITPSLGSVIDPSTD